MISVAIPWMLLVGMAGVKAREFYEAPAGSDVAPKIDFGTSAPAVPAAPAAPAVAPPAPAPAVESTPSAPPAVDPPAAEPPAPS